MRDRKVEWRAILRAKCGRRRLDRRSWLWLVVAAGMAIPGQLRAQDAADLTIASTLLRTWDASGVTIVDGLANVPLAILEAATQERYRFVLTIFDAAENELFQDSWERELSEAAAASTAAGVSIEETFRFGLSPGAYVVELRAFSPETPDVMAAAVLPLEGFETRPVASDLFLAVHVEAIGENGGGRWPIVHGGFGIGAAARPTVLLNQPEIYYYFELYSQEAEPWEASVSAELVAADGRVLLDAPGGSLTVSGSQPFTGRLPLEGLPPGRYELVLHVEGAETAESRSQLFRVMDVVAAVGADEGDDPLADYFAGLSDEELWATFGGVSLILSETERRVFEELPPDGQRRYLTDFFRRTDPNRLTAENEFFDEYVKRMGVVRMRYAEGVGTKERDPWRTPRGRIYLKYGEPGERIAQYFPADEGVGTIGSPSFAGEPPYEIWRYGDTGFVYLFVQEDRVGTWRLIYSTDPDVVTLPDWTQRVGNGALNDLRDHFGIQPRFGPGVQ
jgi:GWxTD domain-containing protein